MRVLGGLTKKAIHSLRYSPILESCVQQLSNCTSSPVSRFAALQYIFFAFEALYDLYIKIGLSRCVTMGVAWMDGRAR